MKIECMQKIDYYVFMRWIIVCFIKLNIVKFRKIMFLLYEMISGREPNEKVFETALKIGMAMLLLLMVFVFYNDFVKLFTGT